MTLHLDLADIQGNILTAYGKLGFPLGRVMLLNIANATHGRAFVTEILPMVTTALRWHTPRRKASGSHAQLTRPAVTMNVGFTWYGLLALELPTRTLRAMPDEFIDGMARRASMLGDNFGARDPSTFDFMKRWDKVWRAAGPIGPHPDRVHAMILLNASMTPEDAARPDPLEPATQAIEAATAAIHAAIEGKDIKILGGHRLDDDHVPYQDLRALLGPDGLPCPKEHFGYTDAIGDPVFEGQYPDGQEKELAYGNGALDGSGNWRPLATGEFLLGYPDEAQEIAGAAGPLDFSRNGTFVAYRKLHQNVARFRSFMMEAAEDFGIVFGIADRKQALDLLKAKIAGRWPDGVPLSVAPTQEEWVAFNARLPDVDPYGHPERYAARNHALRGFTYGDDGAGTRCPVAAHVRRVNTRDMLDPEAAAAKPADRGGSVLNNRRRILRRGLPYGHSPDGTTDADEHGIVMLATCASLFRQFEFMQQQWVNYGLDAGVGNDTDPLIGNHASRGGRVPAAKFVVAADPKAGHPPFILDGIPQFVETRGGDYFFIPSMTALRMIGMGVVDPT